MNDYARELADVEAEVAAASNAPAEEALQRLRLCTRRLAILVSVRPDARATNQLIAIAWQYYMRGYTRHADCLSLAELMVQAATRTGDLAQIRRALSIQGLFLGERQCIHDALRVLARALDVAAKLSDPVGVAAAWLNIGVVMAKARLMRESIASMERALAAAADVDDPGERANMQLAAEHNISDAYAHLQQPEQALLFAERVISRSADRATQLTDNGAVGSHCNAARALVSLGRFAEAQKHATAALELSNKTGAERFRSDAVAVSGLCMVARGERQAGVRAIDDAVAETQGLTEHHINALRDKAKALEILGETERALETHKAIILLTRQLQIEGMEFAKAAFEAPDLSRYQTLTAGHSYQQDALLVLAQRSRKLLDRTRMAQLPRPSRGYLARREKSRTWK